ncbi:MAG: diacylglycerol kinase [Peptostreptococcaceae bacterium]|nr:diacylglycerol kinase [Peptostreptococcaceae bacterium]
MQKRNKQYKNNNFIASLNHAIAGVFTAVKQERNMKIHFIIATLVLILGYLFDISKFEFLLLFMSISFVLITEMINTAMEIMVDLIKQEFSILAKMIKDISAGIVLIASLNALIVGFLVFFKKVELKAEMLVLKAVPDINFIIFLTAIAVVIFVVILKNKNNAKNYLKGGLPSGHSAIAFALATSVLFLTKEIGIIVISYFLALLVAQSRIEGKIHSVVEVILGSIIGIVLMLVFYISFF